MGKELAELGQLKVNFELDYLWIKRFSTIDAASEHGRMHLELVASKTLTIQDVLPLEDAPVKVIDRDGDCVFNGICQAVELVNTGEYSELVLEAKSLSIQSDRKRKSRTFQDPSKTMRDVINDVVATYHGQGELKVNFKIEQILYQNNETDWEFLKRIAAQYGFLLFTDSKAEGMRIAIGTFPFSCKALGNEATQKTADIEKDVQKYIEIRENINPNAQSYEFETAKCTVYDLTVGAGYTIQLEGRRSRHVVHSRIETHGESLQNCLVLAYEDGCRPSSEASWACINRGDYIKGKVMRVRGTWVKVHFSCDPSQDEKTATWISFENTMNNYLYSMPDQGDTVFVYYENNGKAVALGSRRSDKGAHVDYQDPSSKMLTSTNKLIKLTPDALIFAASRKAYDEQSGEQAMIEMTGENGVLIKSNQTIHMKAEKRFTMAATKSEITDQEITQEFIRFKTRHIQGEAKYMAGAGSAAPNMGVAINDQMGVNLKKSFTDGIVAPVVTISKFVENIGSALQSSDNAAAESGATEEEEREPEEVVFFSAVKSCSFTIGSSQLLLSESTVMISTPLYKQLGYTKQEHAEEKAPSVLDTVLDGVQLVLDVVGCVPGLNVVANGINAVVSIARGDTFGAMASLVGCFCPGAGLAGKALKTAAMAAKAAKAMKVAAKLEKASQHTKTVDRFITGGQALVSALQGCNGIFDLKRKLQKGTYSWTDLRTWRSLINISRSGVGTASGSRDVIRGGGSATKKQESASHDAATSQSTSGKGKGTHTEPQSPQAGKTVNPVRAADPIDVVTGSFTMEMTDFRFDDLGETFVLQRSYESIYENRRQHLGSRWLLNLGSQLKRREKRIDVLLKNLHLEQFENYNGIWENLRGGDSSLVLLEVKDGYELRFVHERKIYMYDVFGRLVSMTDANSNRVRVEYAGSAIDRVVLANGKILRFSYENDKLARVTDPLGRSVRYRYEGELLTQVIYPNDGIIMYSYTPEGYIESVTDQNGHCYVKNDYDARGRVVRQELANGGESLLFYRDEDRTTTVATPHNGQRISYIYNRQKLVTKTVYGDGTEEETRYDDKENVVWRKDRRGNETSFRYNEASQVVEETFPNGLIHQIQYDEAARKIEDSDNAGVCIRYSYDAKGNLTEIKSRIEGERWQSVRYEYDAKGRTAAYIDENGGRTEYHYKENDSEPSNVTNPEGDIFRYEYDEAGRTMAMESTLGRKEYAYNNLDRQTLEIDALGNTTKYEYDKLCNLTNVIYPNQYDAKRGTGKGWQSVYDALDEVVRRVDPEGNVLAMRRDADENIVKEIHPNAYKAADDDGAGIENVWDADGRKIKIHYPGGGTERIFYDASGNVVKRVEPESYDEARDDGPGYTYTYDEMNRLTAIRNPRGVVEKAYVYDLVGNIVKEIDAAGYEAGTSDQARLGKLYAYNSLGWLTEKREPAKIENGRTFYALTQYQYDLAGNVTEERRYIDEQDEQSASGRVLCIRFRYDRQNRLVKVEDNTGAAVEYAYNCLNQRIFEKRKIAENTHQIFKYHYDAAGRHVATSQRADREGSGKFTADTKYELDKTGNIVKIVTPAGYMIEREYDDADRLTAETHRDKDSGIENRTEFVYDKANNIVKIKDTNGAEQLYEYNLMNQETKLTKKNGGIEQNIYDRNGRLVRRIMAEEYRKKGEQAKGYAYTYDEEGRIVSVVAPDGAIVETNVYDGAGRLLQTLDATRGGIDYDYDLAGRMKSVVSRGGARQDYEYDARGNIVGVIDGNRNRTEYKLDAWGRIAQIVKADGSKEYYAYDLAGNVSETEDGEGNKIRYAYNQMNCLWEITDQAGTQEHFFYDEEGRIKKHIDRNGNEIEYAYNLYGALREKTEKSGGLGEYYEYYKDGRLKAAIASGMRYDYRYHRDGSLKEKTASGRTLLQFEYDLNGNKIAQIDVTGQETRYDYTDRDLLAEIRDGGKSIVKFSYGADGMRKEAVQSNGMRTLYDYDADKNMRGLRVEWNGQTLAENHYRYDGNGNRVEKAQLRGTTTYAYDRLNRLTKARYPEYTEELYYDRAGNRTRRIAGGAEEQYRYDARNRLISHTKQGVTNRYTYDGAGNLLNDGERTYTYDGFNRTSRVETRDGKVQINRYDAEGLRYEIEENGKLVQFIFNENRDTVTESSEGKINRLIRGFDLWASECTWDKTWYHYAADEQGSIVFVADGTEIKNRYEYDAFGNAIVCEEQVENRFRYTGQQYDPVTRQYYLRARFYNPVIARFTQEDEYRGDGLNLYAYCENNPVMYDDPSGYCKGKDVNAKAAQSEPSNIVYRAINAKDAARLKQGLGLEGKNPKGEWGLEQHITDGSNKKSWNNDPWISTTRDLEVARGFNESGSKLGIVAIDLNKVSSTQMRGWEVFPRTNGVEGLPYQYSIWQQEVSVFQSIPIDAITGVVE